MPKRSDSNDRKRRSRSGPAKNRSIVKTVFSVMPVLADGWGAGRPRGVCDLSGSRKVDEDAVSWDGEEIIKRCPGESGQFT